MEYLGRVWVRSSFEAMSLQLCGSLVRTLHWLGCRVVWPNVACTHTQPALDTDDVPLRIPYAGAIKRSTHSTPHHTALHHTTLPYTAPRHTTPHHTTMQHNTTPH